MSVNKDDEPTISIIGPIGTEKVRVRVDDSNNTHAAVFNGKKAIAAMTASDGYFDFEVNVGEFFPGIRLSATEDRGASIVIPANKRVRQSKIEIGMDRDGVPRFEVNGGDGRYG